MAVLKTSHGSQDDEIRMIKTTIQSRPYASVARSGGNGNSTGPPRLPPGVSSVQTSIPAAAHSLQTEEPPHSSVPSNTTGSLSQTDQRFQWQEAKTKPRKRSLAVHPQQTNINPRQRRQREMVTGTSSGSDLKGVQDRTIKLFTRRWKISVTKEIVTEYVKNI